MRIDVRTVAAPSGEGEPREFLLGNRRVAVEQILDRWHGEGYRYFRLRGDDRAVYILRHDETADDWEMTLFERASASDSGTAPRLDAAVRPHAGRGHASRRQ